MVGAGSLTAEGPGRGLASCRLGSGATGPHFPEMQPGSGVSRAGGLGLADSCTTALGSRELCSMVLAAPSWLSSCNPHVGLLYSCSIGEGGELHCQIRKLRHRLQNELPLVQFLGHSYVWSRPLLDQDLPGQRESWREAVRG